MESIDTRSNIVDTKMDKDDVVDGNSVGHGDIPTGIESAVAEKELTGSIIDKEDEVEESKENVEEGKDEGKGEAEGAAADVDDESDSDDSSSDSDSEDEPPKFKYSRLTNLPSTFFTKDPISTCTFHESVFIFATHSGLLHIVHSDMLVIRTFKAHRASILSVYTDGLYFGSASMDGTVVIGSIVDEKDIIAYDFKRPIHAVVLDKNYKHSRSFITGGMSGKIIRSSKNWLGQRVDTVLDEGLESGAAIVGIFQLQDIILWMNDDGISVYHTTSKLKILTIERPPNSPRGDMYWPRVQFPEVDRIVIAWADHIWLLRVVQTGPSTAEGPTTGSVKGGGSVIAGNGGSGGLNSSKIFIPSSATISFRSGYLKAIEIEHVLKVDDCLIAGISTFRDDLCVLLTYQAPIRHEKSIEFHNPELKLINTTSGEITFEEEIGLKDISNLGLNDYMLGTHIGEKSLPRYFIVSAKDAVIVQEVSLQDQLEWYIDNEKFFEAWKISEHLVDPIKRLNLGVSYADALIKENQWTETAQFLKQLLYLDEKMLPEGEDSKSTIGLKQQKKGDQKSDEYIKEIIQQWENWSNIFIDTDHIEELTPVIPTASKLSITTNVYTSILKYWGSTKTDLSVFYSLLDSWDSELYSLKSIEDMIEEKLETEYSNERLRRYLTQLYVKSHEPIKSVPHLRLLKDNQIMDFLSQHHILANFVNSIPDFIKLRFSDEENEEGDNIHKIPIHILKVKLEDIVDLLVENRHELPPKQIIDLMFNHNLDFMNYFYLEKLNEIDEYLIRSFSNERILLYSQYDRGKLLEFLTKSSSSNASGSSGGYDINKAIELCERNEYIEELVYLLGNIGENRKALMLIINKLDDPAKAIKFAKHQNDEEAWTILLDYSMSKPAFIKALIELADDQSSSFYDPISIIKRIPENVKVEGLKASVTKISYNNDLNLVLNQLILKIIYKESEDISRHFRSEKLLGIEVDLDDDSHDQIEKVLQEFETLVLFEKESNGKVQLATLRDFFKDKPDVKVPIIVRYSNLADKIEHLEQVLING